MKVVHLRSPLTDGQALYFARQERHGYFAELDAEVRARAPGLTSAEAEAVVNIVWDWAYLNSALVPEEMRADYDDLVAEDAVVVLDE